MSRPDYDVGDLIVATKDSSVSPIRRGQVFRCLHLEYGHDVQTKERLWGVAIDGPMPPDAELWVADKFRRIDPKPPAFWTGEIEADQRDKVQA